MAHENIDHTQNLTCRYLSTDFTAADNNAGIVVQINSSGVQASDYGWARPTAVKVPTDTGAAGNMTGVVQTVETPSGDPRAPSGERLVTVATKGVMKTAKTEDPHPGDIGQYVALDTATGRDIGKVTVGSTFSNGVVVGITGTTSADFLLVQWRQEK